MSGVLKAWSDIRRVVVYASIYGVLRTLSKVAGRDRRLCKYFGVFSNALKWNTTGPNVGIIGCGQYAVSTICYFLHFYSGARILKNFDIDKNAAQSLSLAYSSIQSPTADDIFRDPNIAMVFIASNHASHTDYAVRSLESNKDVYCEKPLCVNWEQLKQLDTAVNDTARKFYVGYNRPHSEAIERIRNIWIKKGCKPFSLNVCVEGHVIAEDHWYRIKQEGSRVCGNLGHWIDLFIHFVWQRKNAPEAVNIIAMSADQAEPDDNLAVSYTSVAGDIASIMLTSRVEPFHGISEVIVFQAEGLRALIHDFRTMEIWDENEYSYHKFSPKDVGHKRGVLQFDGTSYSRSWAELKFSTELMLKTKDLVLNEANPPKP